MQREARRRRYKKQLKKIKKKFTKKWDKKKKQALERCELVMKAYIGDPVNKLTIEMRCTKLKEEFYEPPTPGWIIVSSSIPLPRFFPFPCLNFFLFWLGLWKYGILPSALENPEREIRLTSSKNIVFLYLDAKLQEQGISLIEAIPKFDKDNKGIVFVIIIIF